MSLPNLTKLVSTVIQASRVIEKNFGHTNDEQTKPDNTPVTAIDYAVNNHLRAWSANYPDLGYIGEEGNGAIDNKDYLLFVDPLDGTESFLRGIPTCTTIASIMEMREGYGTPIMSVIHNPMTGETWCAKKGSGIYKQKRDNSFTENVSVNQKFSSNKIRTTICAWPGASHNLETISNLIRIHENFNDQQIGALGLAGALVAQGTQDAVVCGSVSAVETAAMSLLVQEAGGVVTDLDGESLDSFPVGTWKDKPDLIAPNGAIIAANPEVALSLLQFILNNQ